MDPGSFRFVNTYMIIYFLFSKLMLLFMLILILCHSTIRSSKIDENYEVNVCVRVYADISFDIVNHTVPIVHYAVSSLSYNFF